MDRYPLRSFNDASPQRDRGRDGDEPRSCSSNARPVELPTEADLEFMRERFAA